MGKVLSKLASLNIVVVSIPAYTTHFFQPLDLTVNGEAKRFMKDKFTKWYSEEVQNQINPGNSDGNDNVNIDLTLIALKPLHTSWLVEAFFSFLQQNLSFFSSLTLVFLLILFKDFFVIDFSMKLERAMHKENMQIT